MARSRAAAKPNIVVIWGDDIGMANLSCYTHGLMGYQTPNIDRIAPGRLSLNVVSSWWKDEARRYGVRFDEHENSNDISGISCEVGCFPLPTLPAASSRSAT